MDGPARKNPRTVEEVFGDFKARRNGLIKALTTDVKDFFNLCDPEKENLCLYGLRNEEWKVNLPGQEAPPVIPEPTLGINFARDGISEKDWLALVSVHSDAWLVSVAFHIAARFGFDKADRKRLFKMMNDLPLISEVLFGGAKETKKKSCTNNPSSSKSKSNSKPGKLTETTHQAKGLDEEGYEKGEGSRGDTLCGVCNKDYPSDVFWICCDVCEKWFHGKCVRITPTKAKNIKNYKCPNCP